MMTNKMNLTENSFVLGTKKLINEKIIGELMKSEKESLNKNIINELLSREANPNILYQFISKKDKIIMSTKVKSYFSSFKEFTNCLKKSLLLVNIHTTQSMYWTNLSYYSQYKNDQDTFILNNVQIVELHFNDDHSIEKVLNYTVESLMNERG